MSSFQNLLSIFKRIFAYYKTIFYQVATWALFLFDVNVIRDMEIDIKEGFRKICQGVEYIVMILDVPIAGLIGVLNMGKLM